MWVLATQGKGPEKFYRGGSKMFSCIGPIFPEKVQQFFGIQTHTEG